MSWESFEDIYTCPVCENPDCVPAAGSRKSPVLVIAEFPGKDEIKKGKPLTGATGSVFRTELARFGIDMNRLRICNLWLHEKNDNERCLEYSVKQVLKEAQDRKIIFLVGSDVVDYFCQEKVTEVNGLLVKAQYLSAPVVIACVQPATVFHQPLGELRFAIETLKREIEKIT